VVPVHTDSVSVLFTTEEATLAAACVAAPLAAAMAVPLTVIHFRTIPFPLFVDAAASLSSIDHDAFKERLQAQGVDARVRVYLCRNRDSVIPMAFRGHSLIVLGGRRRWWPTAAERWRRRLEAAGHFVLFVDVRERRRSGRLEASCA
jgi:hypothetical protein